MVDKSRLDKASSREVLSWAPSITLISMNFGPVGNCGHDIIRQSLTVTGFEMHVHNAVDQKRGLLKPLATAPFIL